MKQHEEKEQKTMIHGVCGNGGKVIFWKDSLNVETATNGFRRRTWHVMQIKRQFFQYARNVLFRWKKLCSGSGWVMSEIKK